LNHIRGNASLRPQSEIEDLPTLVGRVKQRPHLKRGKVLRNTLLKYTNTWHHGTLSDRVQIVIRVACFVAIALGLIAVPLDIFNSDASLTEKLVIGLIFVVTTVLGLKAYASMPDNV
jgi:hypothetical protein